MADMLSLADLADPRDRPLIVSGKDLAGFPENSTLVWFGDIDHDLLEIAELPEELGILVNEVVYEIRKGRKIAQESNNERNLPCYSRRIDRDDGLPLLAVNFGADDGKDSCTILTIANIVGRHGMWIRNDGTECAFRDCVMMLTED